MTQDSAVILLRFLCYSLLCHIVDRWVWGNQRKPTITRAAWYGFLRLVSGAFIGGFILINVESFSQDFFDPQHVYLMLATFFLWLGILVMLGARSMRLCMSMVIAMIVHSLLGFILPKTFLWGFPLYY